MPKFVVKSQILMGGEMYRPGEEIELTKEQAAAMPWALSNPSAEAPAPQPLTREERAEDADRERHADVEREAADKFQAEHGEPNSKAKKK